MGKNPISLQYKCFFRYFPFNFSEQFKLLKFCTAFSLIGKEESCARNYPPKAASTGASVSASKALEENLTPDFKKKLDTWRVKKQSSIQNIGTNFSVSTTTISSTSTLATSPTVATAPITKLSLGSPPKDPDSPKKIDWNKWKTGELKLEGQGLSPLPDQKNLPEEFQKKLGGDLRFYFSNFSFN